MNVSILPSIWITTRKVDRRAITHLPRLLARNKCTPIENIRRAPGSTLRKTLQREARQAGSAYIIPVRLDSVWCNTVVNICNELHAIEQFIRKYADPIDSGMLCVTIGRSIVAEPIRENQLSLGHLPERPKLPEITNEARGRQR